MSTYHKPFGPRNNNLDGLPLFHWAVHSHHPELSNAGRTVARRYRVSVSLANRLGELITETGGRR